MRKLTALIYISFICLLCSCSFLSNSAEQEDNFTYEKKSKKTTKVLYTYEFIFSEKSSHVPLLEQDKIIKLIEENSQLEFLKDQVIDNEFSLIRRINNDLKVAKDVLHSFGYYSGYAKYKITQKNSLQHVIITLYPKEQYKISLIRVRYSHSTKLPEYFKQYEVKREGFFKNYRPYTLPNFVKKLKVDNEYAVATDILKVVEGLPQPLRENGYPKAKIASSAFSINNETKELDGTVFINQGLPATLGEVKLTGNTEVSSEYIYKLCPWRQGAVWDDRYLLEYRDELQKTGLFESIKLNFDDKVYKKYNKAYREKRKKQHNKDLVVEPVNLPVLLEVKEGKKRSIGGDVFYSTDQGLGLNTTWEHRNFLGNGELLKLFFPITDEKVYLDADFRKPAFGFQKQSLLVLSRIGYEKTDAYNQKFAELGIGIEREIREKWWLESILWADYIIPKKWEGDEYSSVSFANTIKYDCRDKKNNATKGFVSKFQIAPLYGFGSDPFSAVVTDIDTSVYFSLTPKTVLALRGAIGSMLGASDEMPKGKRFFLGGGGTVRGFEHQEIGKHNMADDPIGGLSYCLFNSEIRQHVTKELALVTFLDGGMVYQSVDPDFSEKLALGAGVGVRYDTPVGPVRFDFAVPITGAYDGDEKDISDFQIYISIGQAF